jgi:NAD-dependent SIR2 family protein deacetylase
MTYQHKKLIELSDILGFTFTCKECGISISIPTGEKEPKQGRLNKCPACDQEWMVTGNGQSNALTMLRNAFRAFSENSGGFRFALEIPAEPASGPASSGKD